MFFLLFTYICFIIYIDCNIGDKMPQPKKVVLFTTPTCSWCKKIKQYFIKNKIKFKEIDVTRDKRATKEMVRKSGQQGVPVTLINGHPVVGFDQRKIERLLK